FLGKNNDRIVIRLTSAFLPRIHVLRPDESQLCGGDNQFAGALQLECVLDADLIYTIVVTDRNASQTGSYTFSLSRLNPPANALPISYGKALTGTHDPSAELKLYAFTGVNGDRVVVRMAGAFLPSV